MGHQGAERVHLEELLAELHAAKESLRRAEIEEEIESELNATRRLLAAETMRRRQVEQETHHALRNQARVQEAMWRELQSARINAAAQEEVGLFSQQALAEAEMEFARQLDHEKSRRQVAEARAASLEVLLGRLLGVVALKSESFSLGALDPIFAEYRELTGNERPPAQPGRAPKTNHKAKVMPETEPYVQARPHSGDHTRTAAADDVAHMWPPPEYIQRELAMAEADAMAEAMSFPPHLYPHATPGATYMARGGPVPSVGRVDGYPASVDFAHLGSLGGAYHFPDTM